jgi:hypothetical protein
MIFKPKTVDEGCVQEKYLENIGQKKHIQEAPNRKSTKALPRKERRSGKEKTRR